MSSGTNLALRDAATAPLQTFRATTPEQSLDAADTALLGGDAAAQTETPATPQRRPDLRSRRESREIARNDPMAQQLRRLAESKVPPGNPGPFPGLPPGGFPGLQPGAVPQGAGKPGGGGKGGMFAPTSRENAARAMKQEGKIDKDNVYAQDRADTRRRFDQLGLPRKTDARIYVHDLDQEHGDMVTRTIGGKTGLAQGSDLVTSSPRGDAYHQAKKAQLEANPGDKSDPSVDDFVKDEAQTLVRSVYSVAEPISNAAFEARQKNDGKKTFMNMSHGMTPDDGANLIAHRMLTAPQGSKLYQDATRVLGHAPTVKDGFSDAGEAAKLKQELIYPKLRAEMATPEYQASMKEARETLTKTVADARQAGVMVFQSAGNSNASAERAGDASMGISTSADIPGLFRVGATRPNGRGTADDTISAMSSGGPVTASMPGEDIPVARGKNGKAFSVGGTSFSAPQMTEAAYLVSAANPKLNLDQIEKVLTDPRVATDIAGTTRDGAGVVDPFAASLVARYPNITAQQIAEIRSGLDANPQARFEVLPDGTLKKR